VDISGDCVICLERLEDGRELSICGTCRAIYHKECADKWINSDGITCPNCRSRIPYAEEDTDTAPNSELLRLARERRIADGRSVRALAPRSLTPTRHRHRGIDGEYIPNLISIILFFLFLYLGRTALDGFGNLYHDVYEEWGE